MLDEQALRRPSYVEGTPIRLADDQVWTFPDHPPYKEDLEQIAVLREVVEAEDAADLLRAELALAIYLLSRNYHLTPKDFQEILEFAPGDPALAEMQRSVHEIATRQTRALRFLPDSNTGSLFVPPTHGRLFNLLKRPSTREAAMRCHLAANRPRTP